MNASDLTQTVSIFSIICMGISALLIIFFPVFLYRYITKKTEIKFYTVIIGAIVYVVIGMLGTGLLGAGIFYIPGTAEYFKEHQTLSVSYYAVLTVVVEQLGLFAAIHFMQTKYRGIGNLLGMAIGYGGASAVLIAGVTILSNISVAMTINSSGLESLISDLSATESAELLAALQPLIKGIPLEYLISGIGQVGMMLFYCCSAAIIWLMVTRKGPKRLLGLSLLFHGIILFSLNLSQFNFIFNQTIMTIIFLLEVAGYLFITYQMMKNYDKENFEKFF